MQRTCKRQTKQAYKTQDAGGKHKVINIGYDREAALVCCCVQDVYVWAQ